MLARPRLPLVALASALLLAGCLQQEDAPLGSYTDEGYSDASAGSEDEAPAASNATLPDGRGQSAGLTETNRTEAGIGGMEHKHDYWKGREQVVLLQRFVDVISPPFMPDGEGSEVKGVGYVKLRDLPDASGTALVYEGAERVEVLIGAPAVLWRQAPLAHPLPPRITLQYRSAADAEWQPPIDVTYDVPIVIDVEPMMADMPHSTHSLWVFRLTSDRPEANLGVPLTVTVFRGRDVVDWPGHPEFYSEKHERVVMDKPVTTHMNGVESAALYDSGNSWVAPPKLISWGTKEIHVFINISRALAPYAQPTGYFLEAHNATIIGPEISIGSRHRDVDGNDDLKSYHFAILVDENGMDGPYQPSSRWGFRLEALFGDVDGVIGLCPGCFPYDLEYDMKIVALDHETGVGQPMEKLE